MNIAWDQFTPVTALAGGALIGLAAALLAVLSGRVAGVSGIVGGLLAPVRGEIGWRAAFVAGMVGAPLLWRAMAGPPSIELEAGAWLLLAAGFLVGLSTRYGAGCTSGHGVCGISRLSVRSVVATLAFMFTGFATTYVARHLLGS